ncbi:LytTR family DNA-binding domain-containing protein [Marinoscillum sp. MHG1-6]|uniref:LytR/AlgR family response regulator transcription factor n=1 Tax=Marinoscillum sp. MHG1-6 TaxID=2959627 RepID=UPI0021584EB4|nr:LytTR family DNA-binding domain-containing protein [Marinoscillum sp. MHG1-6]
MLRALIIEDEKHSRETLKNLLRDYCDGVEVVGEADSVPSGIELINHIPADVVFLDIELQSGTGFDILKRIQNISFETIFTTAFEQYAIQAIKMSSLDYLLKPISIDELQAAVEKCKTKNNQQYSKQLDVLMQRLSNENKDKNICLSTAEGMEFIKENEILFCKANGSYTDFRLKNGRNILVSKHLKEYEDLLPSDNFMRVHNSYLINLTGVKKFVKSEGGYILMNDESMVSISPKKKDEFMERMSNL